MGTWFTRVPTSPTRPSDWTKNYRCPDVLVFLPGNPAEDRGTHWLGGPDFAVEIMSRGDRSRKKLDFYAKVGVRELLLIDRRPWKLELYRRHDDRLELAALLEPGSPQSITSTSTSGFLPTLDRDAAPPDRSDPAARRPRLADLI